MNLFQKPHHLAHIPTAAIIVLFFFAPWMGPWLSITLYILKKIDADVERKELAAERQFQKQAADYARYGEEVFRAIDPELADHPTAEQLQSKKRQNALSVWCKLLGAVFAISGYGMLAEAGENAALAASFSAGLLGMVSPLLSLASGIALGALGFHFTKMQRLEKRLDRLVGGSDNMPLAELFQKAGIPEEKGRKILLNAIDHGYFGAAAYIDSSTDTLIVRGQPPKPPQPQTVEETPTEESEYQRLLRNLRRINDAIPDPVMTQKIARLESVSARIFALAEEDPNRRPELNRFMDYYLPTALKLLDSYASLCRQDISGENIRTAKREIENSMDMLVSAFEKQLDKLYQTDALNISSDIAALQGMLNLDGLAGESDFSPKA